MAKKIPLLLLGLCIVGDAFVWVSVIHAKTVQPAAYFLNVGQGDAELIMTPGGNRILIDAGPDERVVKELGKILPSWDNYIDLAIISHPQVDHFAGLLPILRSYRMGAILWNGEEAPAWKTVESRASAEHVVVLSVLQKDDVKWSGGEFRVLWPTTDVFKIKNQNDDAMAGLLSADNFSVMFTSDINSKTEAQLGILGDIHADILKVGHHGSKTSTSADFLKAVQPAMAVIEVGKGNKYGHPTPEALGRLADAMIPVLRTDQLGSIRVQKINGVLQAFSF